MSSFTLLRPRCAGVDLGSQSHYAAGPDGSCDPPVRRFGCFTRDLQEMADWFSSLGVEDVVMEATGVYWVPVYELLAGRGFKVALVDGRSAKALPGRKTDVQDCQWLRDLHAHGLLRPCMVPAADVLAVRSYWRQRQRLIEQRSEQILLMHKALEQMNVQLHKVLSDVTGRSGMDMIRAILSGERDPSVLASMARGRVKADRSAFEQSFEGNWLDHHLFALEQAVQAYDFFGQRMADCDSKLDALLGRITGGPDVTHPRGGTRKNQPRFDACARAADLLGADPTLVPGIDASTGMTLVSELGWDLGAFPSEKHFVSYLGLCPANRITGGRVRSSRTRKVRSRAATALRVAAQSVSRGRSALSACYRRLKARLGPEKAMVAVARKIAVAYYRLVRYGVLYEDPGADAYENTMRELRVRKLEKMAQRLGLTVTDPATQTT